MNEIQVVLRGDSALTQLPKVLWNKDEVTAALNEMLSAYKGRQYTEDEIKDAKKDRASVNHILHRNHCSLRSQSNTPTKPASTGIAGGSFRGVGLSGMQVFMNESASACESRFVCFATTRPSGS